MENFGNRYMLAQAQPLKRMTNGLLVRGTEPTLKQDVLLYTFQEPGESEHREAMSNLENASRCSGGHFMRILDVGSQNGNLFAVLRAEEGGPLSDRLPDLEITGRQALLHAYELSKALREARRNRLPECSVDAENLWMEENGRLRIINFWKEGPIGRRSVPGLALLLYQLGARTDVPTSSMIAYSYELNRMLADEPESMRERAVALACKAYDGICTLAYFQQELEAILGINGGREEPLPSSAKPAIDRSKSKGSKRPAENKPDESKARPKTNPGNATGTGVFPKPFRESFQQRKRHLFAFTGLGVFVLALWFVLRPHPDQVNGSKRQPTPTPSPAAVSANSTETRKPSAPAGAAEPATPSATPSARPAAPDPKPAGDNALQVKAGVMPDLVTHTREEAEKMAIASGLRYQYFLEANSAASGVVFKQEPPPGTAVPQGDRITFWVSKGK